MQLKRSPFIIFLFLPLAGPGGCTAPVPDKVAPTPRQAIRVACPGDPAAAVVRAYGRGWAVRHNASIPEVVAYDPHQGLNADLAADIWLVPPVALPRLAAAHLLRPMPKSFRDERDRFDGRDFLDQFLGTQLTSWDGVHCGIPVLGEAPICVYRSDRLNDPSVRSAFQKKWGRPLAPPQTWEEFADIAEFFQTSTTASLPPLPSRDDDLDREFYTLAACYARRAVPSDESTNGPAGDEQFAFHCDLTTGKPRLDEPGFIHALQMLKRLQACRPTGVAIDPAQTFAEGRAIFCLTEASRISAWQNISALRDRFDICPMPGAGCYHDFKTGVPKNVRGGNRVPYLGAGGWMAVVPQSAGQPEAAFDLLAYLAGPEISRQIVIEPRWGGGATRREHLKGPSVRWESFNLNEDGTRALKDALEQTLLHPRMKNPVLKLRTPDAAQRQALVIAAVRRALAGELEPAAALAAAAHSWTELDKTKGPSALVDYRLSLGLRGP